MLQYVHVHKVLVVRGHYNYVLLTQLQDLASMAGGMHPENPALENFFTQIAYYSHVSFVVYTIKAYGNLIL